VAKKSPPQVANTVAASTPAEKKPWYADGLQFECTQCGRCCGGAPGFVWVNASEISAMAEEQGAASIADFEAQFVRKVGARKSLREFENGDCIFLDPQKRTCTLYNSRPRQCRTWPFWDSNLKTPEEWAHTCEVCPGAGEGKLYSLEVIETQRKVMHI
jgi:Fe-S-cluster containining protein